MLSTPYRKPRAGCWAHGNLYSLFMEAYLKIQMDECSPGQERDSRGDSQEVAWRVGWLQRKFVPYEASTPIPQALNDTHHLQLDNLGPQGPPGDISCPFRVLVSTSTYLQYRLWRAGFTSFNCQCVQHFPKAGVSNLPGIG